MLDIVKLDPGYFPDPKIGRPVSNGTFFVGIIDLDPEILANQKQVTVRQESGAEVEIDQPINLSAGGVPEYQGSPVTVFVDGEYSLKVLNSTDDQVYYIPKSTTTTPLLTEWDDSVTYNDSDIVRDDSLYYISVIDDNLNNKPPSFPLAWETWPNGNITCDSVTADEFIGDLTGNVTGDLAGTADNASALGGVDADQIFHQIKTTVFTSSGTWTKDSKCLYVKVQAQSAGGGSGGCNATGSGEVSISVGGSGGGYGEETFIESDLSATETITIGSAGAAGAAGVNQSGGTADTSSFGTHIVCVGGTGGGYGFEGSDSHTKGPESPYGGTATGGTINVQGRLAGLAIRIAPGDALASSNGGDSFLGTGGFGQLVGTGESGSGNGGGGGGSGRSASSSASVGVAGQPGVIIITEYLGI